MTARLLLLAATIVVLAFPATASAGDEPIWDCTDVPFRVTPFSCVAYGAVEDVLDKVPAR